MKKSAIVVLAALAMSLNLPCWADGSDSGSMLKNSAMFPVRALAVGSAIVLGTPIALARQTTVRIRQYTSEFADKIGGHEDFPPNFFASFLSVPCGLIVGTGEGLYYGGKNAIENGADKPFSLESFSFGDYEK